MQITLNYNLLTHSLKIHDLDLNLKEELESWYEKNYFSIFFSINEFINDLENLNTGIDKFLRFTVTFKSDCLSEGKVKYLVLLNEYFDPFYLNCDDVFEFILNKNTFS